MVALESMETQEGFRSAARLLLLPCSDFSLLITTPADATSCIIPLRGLLD